MADSQEIPLGQRQKHPSVKTLLRLDSSSSNASCSPNESSSHNVTTTRNCNGLCYCATNIDAHFDEFSGWEGRPRGPGNSPHCRVSQSSSMSWSASETSLIGTSTTSHKPSLSRTTSIGKSDSRSSLRSSMFDLPHIAYEFSHCEDDEDVSVYIDKYKTSHTYPNMEQRMRSASSASGRIPLCSGCASSAGSSQMIQPKLIVLGEVSNKKPHTYAKPFQAQGQV